MKTRIANLSRAMYRRIQLKKNTPLVSQRGMVKKIVGHKGQGVTQTVYTHFEIEALLDAINKIQGGDRYGQKQIQATVL